MVAYAKLFLHVLYPVKVVPPEVILCNHLWHKFMSALFQIKVKFEHDLRQNDIVVNVKVEFVL